MGFRENLKEELKESGMLVKELAVASGVKKTTIDGYLKGNGYKPSAEHAVRIAEALGVSVEYLVTGEEIKTTIGLLSGEMRRLLRSFAGLSRVDKKFALKNIRFMIESLKERAAEDAGA
jgi:transcriptional regulator with XRE-family HTH domain